MLKLSVPNPSSWSRRERLIAAGSVFVLTLLVIDRLVLGPWLKHSVTIRQDIRKLEESIRTQRQLLSRWPVIQAEAAAYAEFLDPKSVGAVDMASLLREIESLGAESGVSLGEVKPLASSSNSLYDQLAIEVHCRGSMEQWVHFMYLLQTSKSLLEIERASVEKSNDDPSVVDGTTRLTSKLIRNQAAPPTEKPAA